MITRAYGTESRDGGRITLTGADSEKHRKRKKQDWRLSKIAQLKRSSPRSGAPCFPRPWTFYIIFTSKVHAAKSQQTVNRMSRAKAFFPRKLRTTSFGRCVPSLVMSGTATSHSPAGQSLAHMPVPAGRGSVPPHNQQQRRPRRSHRNAPSRPGRAETGRLPIVV